jgi:hypothetical protein
MTLAERKNIGSKTNRMIESFAVPEWQKYSIQCDTILLHIGIFSYSACHRIKQEHHLRVVKQR